MRAGVVDTMPFTLSKVAENVKAARSAHCLDSDDSPDGDGAGISVNPQWRLSTRVDDRAASQRTKRFMARFAKKRRLSLTVAESD